MLYEQFLYDHILYSFFIEICNKFNMGSDHCMIANRYFGNVKTVTKDKLGIWLETVSHIVDHYCIPWLQKSAPLAEEARNLRNENETLKAENSAYQKQIIDLQNQLIEKQDEQLKSVKATVETEMKSCSSVLKSEMKSYSAAVSKSCSAALAPKKL